MNKHPFKQCLIDPWDFAEFVIRHYNQVFPIYKKYIRKYTLNYDAHGQAAKYCQLLLEEEIKNRIEGREKYNNLSEEIKWAVDQVITDGIYKEKDNEKALDYLIHGDPGKRPQKVRVPDYLQVIDGGNHETT